MENTKERILKVNLVCMQKLQENHLLQSHCEHPTVDLLIKLKVLVSQCKTEPRVGCSWYGI